MNKTQRNQNRSTASWLGWVGTRCPECGKPGPHWISVPATLNGLMEGVEQGFWTCDKFYGADGRRIEK